MCREMILCRWRFLSLEGESARERKKGGRIIRVSSHHSCVITNNNKMHSSLQGFDSFVFFEKGGR